MTFCCGIMKGPSQYFRDLHEAKGAPVWYKGVLQITVSASSSPELVSCQCLLSPSCNGKRMVLALSGHTETEQKRV